MSNMSEGEYLGPNLVHPLDPRNDEFDEDALIAAYEAEIALSDDGLNEAIGEAMRASPVKFFAAVRDLISSDQLKKREGVKVLETVIEAGIGSLACERYHRELQRSAA